LYLAQILFILAVFVSSIYWIVLYGRIHFSKEVVRYGEKRNKSIVIAGKDEYVNIQQNLPFLADLQDITEIIFVNDHSSDDSNVVLKQLAAKNQMIKIIIPSKNIPGKKLGLTEGIEHSNTNIIVLTDADCKPADPKWAQIMGSYLDDDHRLVLGYGPLKKTTGWVNAFSRFETIITAIQYFGFALLKIPYMGVGRNMAFRKDLFKDVNGYNDHMHIPSGDDDLLVQQAAKNTNIRISLDRDSFVYSDSKATWNEYTAQKKRHMAVSTSYSLMHQVLLSIHPFLHILSFMLGVFLLFNGCFTLVLSVMVIRWIVLMITGYSSFKRLDGKDLFLFIPIFDIMLIPYYLYFAGAAFNPKNAKWS